MEKALEMAVSGPGSGLSTFLAYFDSLEFNSLPASHFHHSGPPYGNFLCLLKVCHSWKDYSKPMGTSPVGSEEAYS